MTAFALFDAAFANDPGRIAKEIASGSDPNLPHPSGGHTALSVACEMGAANAVSALIDGGANPNQSFAWRSQVSGRNSSGRTALMSASTAEVVSRMVAAGAEIDVTDEQGWSPLVHAVDMVNLDVVEKLLDLGASTKLHIMRGGVAQDLESFIADKIAHVRELSEKQANPKTADLLAQLIDIHDRVVSA